MNYYAHGGQAHGLKSLAAELPKYGRDGDTIVAHINPQEAQMLKAMGGSGTINPTTGLPEFGLIPGVSNPFKGMNLGSLNPFNPGSGINKTINEIPVIGGINKSLLDAQSAIIKPIDQALVGVDKAVGKAIPGGWGTLGMAAASFIPGMTPLMMAGLGALNGSGMLRPNGKFNMQGALMGGAMAYGMANLSAGLQNAGTVPTTVPTPDIPVPVAPVVTPTPPTDFIGSFAGPNPPVGGDMISSFSGPNPAMGSGYTPPPAPTYMGNMSNAGQGVLNVSGLGPEGVSATAAQKAFGATGATGITPSIQNTALPIVMGGMGLADVEAQRNYEKEVNAANSQANADYNTQLASIADSQKYAEDIMRKNPYKFSIGGSMPRFLSGGGDGLSDDIDAKIGSNQPAKLSDGEFVVSADVVSGLGGGSSKAGAQKLYAMMDRVRQQAHGTKKQVRKVSNAALPA